MSVAVISAQFCALYFRCKLYFLRSQISQLGSTVNDRWLLVGSSLGFSIVRENGLLPSLPDQKLQIQSFHQCCKRFCELPRLVWFIWLICNFRLTLTLQGKWRLADGSQTPRNILMRVLSNVNAIYIRAFYGNGGSIPATLRYKFKKSNLLYNRLLSVLVLCRLGDLWFLFSMTTFKLFVYCPYSVYTSLCFNHFRDSCAIC